jgi:hypothetical protein
MRIASDSASHRQTLDPPAAGDAEDVFQKILNRRPKHAQTPHLPHAFMDRSGSRFWLFPYHFLPTI